MEVKGTEIHDEWIQCFFHLCGLFLGLGVFWLVLVGFVCLLFFKLPHY